MSDQPQGPGWWQASDGKWYPPQSLPPPPGQGFPNAPQAYRSPSPGLMGWLRKQPVWLQIVAWLFFWWVLLFFLLWQSNLSQRTKIWITVASVGGFLIIGAVGAVTTPKKETVSATKTKATTTTAARSVASSSSSAATTTAPSTTTTSTTQPSTTTTAPPSQKDILVGKLVDKLGRNTNRDGISRFALIEITDDGTVQIQMAFDDNISSGYVKDGARIDTVKVMKVVHDVVGSYAELDLVGTFALQDQLGNSSEEVVVKQYYPKDLLDQINYDNFDFHNAWKISPIPGYVHPAFQGE